MTIDIREANTVKEIRQYIKFAWEIYSKDPQLSKYWVPHLISDYQKTLDVSRYPLWEHAERQCFFAEKDGKIVGTITAIKNGRHLEYHHDHVGFWGFFECIDNQEVANALFDSVLAWLKTRGLTSMRGPISPSMNDQVGMLSVGYDSPPVFLMTYNPQYYHELCRNYGFEVVQELSAWQVTELQTKKGPFQRVKRISDLVLQRQNITVRKLQMDKYHEEIDKVLSVYNQAWESNWGFVPMTNHEFKSLAKDLKQIIDPDLVFIAEDQRENPVGVSISVPDINIALKHVNGNPMSPLGIVKFFWYKRSIHRIRVIAMGTVASYRNKGLNSVFCSMTTEEGIKKGYSECEFSWVLKSNEPMIKMAEAIQAKMWKEYMLYEKKI